MRWNVRRNLLFRWRLRRRAPSPGAALYGMCAIAYIVMASIVMAYIVIAELRPQGLPWMACARMYVCMRAQPSIRVCVREDVSMSASVRAHARVHSFAPTCLGTNEPCECVTLALHRTTPRRAPHKSRCATACPSRARVRACARTSSGFVGVAASSRTSTGERSSAPGARRPRVRANACA